MGIFIRVSHFFEWSNDLPLKVFNSFKAPDGMTRASHRDKDFAKFNVYTLIKLISTHRISKPFDLRDKSRFWWDPKQNEYKTNEKRKEQAKQFRSI